MSGDQNNQTTQTQTNYYADPKWGPIGLSSAEAEERRARCGENRLPAEKAVSVLALLLNQIRSPLVNIILAAAALSLVLGEKSDAAIILVVVIIDVIMGFAQEYQAQRTYVSLKEYLQPTATAIRDGKRVELEVWELVPGDLVVLNAGEKIPGDGVLLEATRLSVDESILTGESEPVSKLNTVITDPLEISKGMNSDKSLLAYMGTTVVTGRGILRIEKTGTQTELGQIAASLEKHEEADTPFQIRLKAFSRILTVLVIGFTGIILIAGLAMGRDFLDMLRIAIILAVAAVPEGLLIAVTVILVLGMRKILIRKGLTRKLQAVETLGSVTVICTDKTGTLTEGSMRVSRAELKDRERALQTMVLCNNLEGPIDAALWQYAEDQLKTDPQELSSRWKRFSEELFTSETKFMITEMGEADLSPAGVDHFFFMKGAPEIVLNMCGMEPSQKQSVMDQIEDWADEGLRLLGVAYRTSGTLEDRTGYVWAGLLGIDDPIRSDVIESVAAARRAGIKIKMITGDYRRTAERIAANIGILEPGCTTLEGTQIAALSDEELLDKVGEAAVFARIRPNDKYRIVEALQLNGEITAMIGDGVNDAPALKRSDIGVVVGSAADVAKETADLILLDSHFSTIVAAVEEGRIIFSNVRKSISYMLSNSFAEVLTIFAAMLLNWPTPLLVAQILWIHLICDGPSDIVLGFEKKESGIMDEKPRPLKDPILTRLALVLIGVISISSAVFSLVMFYHIVTIHGSVAEGRSFVFASLAINSMVYIFSYRSMKLPIWRMNSIRSNKPLLWAVAAGLLTILIAFLVPGLRVLLGLVLLTPSDILLLVGFAFALLVFVEIGKAVANRISSKKNSNSAAEA